MVVQLFQKIVFFRHRLQFHHCHVATLGEVPVLVQHIGDAARHSGGEVAPGLADYDDDAASHVLAPMIAYALDHRDGTGVAHAEALAGDAAEVAFAGDCAVKHGVADNNGFFGLDRSVLDRAHHQTSPRQSLADIVVAVAFQIEGNAMREKRTEALPGGTLEGYGDGVLGQTRMAVFCRQNTRQHGAGRTVRVVDREFHPYRRLVVQRVFRRLDQLAIEDVGDRVLLKAGVMDFVFRGFGLEEYAGKIQPLGLPVVDHAGLFQHLALAGHLGDCAVAHRRHERAHFLGDKEEIIDDMLRRAAEALAQHRVLRGDADGTRIEMAFAHHQAARGDERRGGKAELVGTEQRADDNVAPGAQTAVDLQRDTAAQPVQHQCLVGFGESHLPGRTGMFQRRKR